MFKRVSLRWAFAEDPRGNFVIGVEDGQIVVRHENSSGAITTLRGANARGLYKEIWARKLISMPDHAMYVVLNWRRLKEVFKKVETTDKTGLNFTG